MQVDWDAIQIQYEVFHERPEVLAAENNIEPGLIEYAIEKKGWVRAPMKGAMNKVQDLGDVDEMTEDILAAMGDRLSAINMLKAATMNPRYIALETAILNKARDIVTTLIPNSPNAGDQLRKVTEVLQSLRERSIPQVAGNGQNADDGRIIVNVLNQNQIETRQPEPAAIPILANGSSAGAR